MTDAEKDIVGELREDARQLNTIFPDRIALTTRAADTITTLRAEVERLEGTLRLTCADLAGKTKWAESEKARAEKAEAALRLAKPYVENFMAEEGTEEADAGLAAMFAIQAVLSPCASLTESATITDAEKILSEAGAIEKRLASLTEGE